MRIGLFISEFNDSKEYELCEGADLAAKELGAELVIFPGKNITDDKKLCDRDPYAYQHKAVFDYFLAGDFDGAIIDIASIGNKVPILKRERFLKRFSQKPLLTLTETEGYDSVISSGDESYAELGFLAVEQLLFKITGSKAQADRKPLQEYPEYTALYQKKTLDKITSVTNIIYNDENKNQSLFAGYLANAGINDLEAYLLEETAECSIKKGWKIPAHCNKLFAVNNGKPEVSIDDSRVKISDVFNNTCIHDTIVIRNFFFGSEQLGFVLSAFTEDYRLGVFDDILINTITAANVTDYLKNCLSDTEEELSECQEELARDGSVLDHIGDLDYLTGLPNRRGFFAQAYDLLKASFKEDTYAVVSYIDMESLKNINAIHGHDEGDHAVKRVADVLKEVFGENSVCGRIRGDEFAVIQVTDEEDKAEVLRSEMARQNNRLLMDNTKYINHLVYSICEFGYDESLSLREMLRETDDNLKNIRRVR